jgi:hypothetical protein
MTGWRNWALAAGMLVAVCGLVLWVSGGPVMLLVFGVLMTVTAALEPIYGQANGKPANGNWQPTDEKFVDPETGRLVSVWFDRQSGERSYVDDGPVPPA